MKTLNILFTFAALSLAMVSCKNEVKTETNEVAEVEATETIAVNTEMQACAKRIEKKLSEMDGVKSATVDFDKKLAMVEFEEGKVTTTSLEETVKGAGDMYSVTEMKTVESFTSSEAKGKVAHECTDKCHKEGCTAEMKAACKKDCKKACCAKKA